eukprot:s2316_g9.t1
MRTLPWFRGPQIYLALLRHLGTAEFWRPSSCKQDLALGPQWVLFHTCERKRAASDYTEVPVECVPELVQRTIASTGIILQYPNMVTIPDTEMKQVMANATGTPSVAVCIEVAAAEDAIIEGPLPADDTAPAGANGCCIKELGQRLPGCVGPLEWTGQGQLQVEHENTAASFRSENEVTALRGRPARSI